MRSPSLRHVVHLRLRLADQSTEIWREIAVDRELTLADLNRIAIRIVGGPRCGHHLFTDHVGEPDWMRTPRRWGDRWTMIDFRDPTVIDETTARIGATFARSGTLFLTHTCDARWVVAIEAGIDDIVPVAEPPARVIGGDGLAPLPCSRSDYEHSVLAGVLDDSAHPDHAAYRDQLSWLRGPWADAEPAPFDVASAQESLGTLFGAPESPGGPMLSFVAQLPEPAQSSARDHVAAAGLDLPTVVTADDVDEFVRVFRWVVRRAGADGIPIHSGEVDSGFVTDAAAVLAIDEPRVRQIVTIAKRLHLLYTRQGRLRANKSALESAKSASSFWSTLAEKVKHGAGRGASPEACQLFLLAISDGSLSDPTIGTNQISHAYALICAVRAAAHRDYHYHRDDECGQRCECPASAAGTWHDLVTATIRNAADAAAADGADTVVSRVGAYEIGVPSEWTRADPTEADQYRSGRYRSPAWATRPQPPRAEEAFSVLLAGLGDLIEVLSLLGLERDEHGSWLVPPTLREFARACLTPDRRQTGDHRTTLYTDAHGAW